MGGRPSSLRRRGRLRYRFPAQEGWRRPRDRRRTDPFSPARRRPGLSLPLDGFTTSHEARYQKKAVAEIPDEWLLGLPLLAELPGTGWLAVMEANLTDYAGCIWRATPARRGHPGLPAIATARRAESRRAGRPAARVALAGPHDRRQGRAARRVGPRAELERPLRSGRYFLDQARQDDVSLVERLPRGQGPVPDGAEHGDGQVLHRLLRRGRDPYHSLDGKGNAAWYGGPIVPYEGADITRGVAGLDLREVLRYAATKGVKIRLWMHWQAAEAHMDRAFPLYREWGVEGVMLDFMDRDDQEMVNLSQIIHRCSIIYS